MVGNRYVSISIDCVDEGKGKINGDGGYGTTVTVY